MSTKEKLKHFFRINKNNFPGTIRSGDDFVLTEEIQKDLSRESSVQTRTRALRDLNQALSSNKVNETCIVKIWGSIQDLLKEQTDLGNLAVQCVQCLITGHGKSLNMLRAQIFRVISEQKSPQDIGQRFELLLSLTENGKDIEHFEEKIGPFLLEWMSELTRAGKTQDFLRLLINLIKFHSARLTEEVIVGFVNHICALRSSTNNQQIIFTCIDILDTIVAYYRNLPYDSLSQFIGTLCRVVNAEAYCQISWKIMKNLLGTHMGHSAIFTMCRILQEPELKNDTELIRGAVFFIYMGLWEQPLLNLRCPPTAVLPSLLQAVKCNHPFVTYEVAHSMDKLVNKYQNDLQDPSWDLILQILSLIIKQISDTSLEGNRAGTLVATCIEATLTTIENLIKNGTFYGNVSQFYNLIGECAATRPETSVMGLICYLAEDITPVKNLWLKKLNLLLHRYYKYENEKRTNIRLKVLDVLSNAVRLHRLQFEDELIECIVIPHLIDLARDNDYKIRSAGAALLVELCMHCESKRCIEMLDILDKLLNRPFLMHANENIPATDMDTADVKTVVTGLIKVLMVKIHKLPSVHAITIYKMLVNHLEHHYNKPRIFENCSYIRISIFECFMNMRADNLYRLGCLDSNGVVKYSSYLCVTYGYSDKGPLASPPPASPAITQQPPCTITNISIKSCFKMFITCLKQEKDWDVLNGVLRQLPKVLQNKSLILTKTGNTDMGILVNTIILIINNYKSIPDSQTTNINRSDFYMSVLTILHGLVNYHAQMDSVQQSSIIVQFCALKFGSGLCSPQCIMALTTCTLEMQDVMAKVLPKVLLNLSQSSATVHIAIPVLEFLSTLTILPKVYANFVPDQYMATFAILLPYTNAFKYNHYIVSLAHRVIAVWFLKCRLPLRKQFVKFIINALQTNDLGKLNEDSSDRKRSSSLTEQRSMRRDAECRMESKSSLEFRPAIFDKSLIPFYTELAETCIELMARYTFLPCSALPKRLPIAEFLLSGGQSMSWLLGNRVITVTTSGCSQKVLKHGLCDKCLAICKVDSNKTPDDHMVRNSRSGSNDKDDSTRVTRQNSGSNNNTSASSPIEEGKRLHDKLEQLPGKLQQLAGVDGSKTEKQRCVCWCQGWAEIYIRRPTGDTSWIMKIQNQTSHQSSIYEFPLSELSTLFKPSLRLLAEGEHFQQQLSVEEDSNKQSDEGNSVSMPISIPGSPSKQSPSRQNSRDSGDEDVERVYDDGGRSRNPVRRSNSSPEMSANWKNPFLKKPEREREDFRNQEDDGAKKSGKNYTKDMKVSCEAIPEEIAGMGTTPPSNDPVNSESSSTHPFLLSSLSYPGPPNTNETVAKPYQTVPATPVVTQSNQGLLLVGSSNYTNKYMLKNTKSDSIDCVTERPSNLNIMMPLMSKPPQSPTQTSPRLSRHKTSEGHEIQKSSSLVLEKTQSKDKKSGSMETGFNSSDQNLQKRDRGYTISVMSPIRKPRGENIRQPAVGKSKETPKSGVNPSFVFLQLYHSAQFGTSNEKPLLINSSDIGQRALKVLDCIPPYEMHKVGVIYVGPGQCNKETEILRNKYGSVRYADFLRRLGSLIKIQDVDPQVFFLGGLDQNGGDGKFAYIWQDDVIRVMFHVATIMPNKESDASCNNKKAHIGNSNITIVYNDSGEDYNINTMSGQFNFAAVIIQPLDHCTNKVTVKAKEELTKLIGNSEPRIVSDQNVAILSRQLALHANLASLVLNSVNKSKQDPYASNWVERLRKIKNLRKKVQDSRTDLGNQQYDFKSRHLIEDFTEYT